MSRRRIALVLVFLAVLAAGALLESQRIITGWLRGESFYRGRPSSYWAGELARWRYRAGPWYFHWVREPAAWEKYVPFGWLKNEPSHDPPEFDLPVFDLNDPAAKQIAEKLSEDPDPAVADPARFICRRMSGD